MRIERIPRFAPQPAPAGMRAMPQGGYRGAHAHLFVRKRDDGRADAALLALYRLRQLGAAATHPEQKEAADV